MAVDVKLKPVSINFTLKDHIYDVLRESILKVDIYDADSELRLDERQLAEQLRLLRILPPLAVLDVRPLRMSGHEGSCAAAACGRRAGV